MSAALIFESQHWAEGFDHADFGLRLHHPPGDRLPAFQDGADHGSAKQDGELARSGADFGHG
ncbi:hypothetical protein D9M70_535660 [compost metagenome]